MLVTKGAEQKRLARARLYQCLDFTPYKAAQVLEEVRAEKFPGVGHKVSIHFVDCGTLACIAFTKERAHIYVHQCLNHPETPRELMELLCVHEVLHLEIPPRMIKGRRESHPPEFWERENELFPGHRRCWTWLHTNWIDCIRPRPRLKQIDVLPQWRHAWLRPKVPIDKLEEDALGHRYL